MGLCWARMCPSMFWKCFTARPIIENEKQFSKVFFPLLRTFFWCYFCNIVIIVESHSISWKPLVALLTVIIHPFFSIPATYFCHNLVLQIAAIFKIGNSKDLPAIPDHLSEDGKDFIRSCLQRDPFNRPTSIELLQHPFVRKVVPMEKSIINPKLRDQRRCASIGASFRVLFFPLPCEYLPFPKSYYLH